jgi:hypothetical protein
MLKIGKFQDLAAQLVELQMPTTIPLFVNFVYCYCEECFILHLRFSTEIIT